MQFFDADDRRIQYANFLIIGEPKAGKTKLAALMPGPLFLDLDRGAAHTGCPRLQFATQGASYTEVLNALEALARLEPKKDGLLHWKPQGAKAEIAIGSVIIDTIDELQRITDMTISSTGHRYWSDMLKKMQAVVNAARRINAHVAFIGHTKEVSHTDENGKELEPTEVTIELQGAVGRKIPYWFDVILHLYVEPDGTRKLLTRKQMAGGKSYFAGDRYNVFKGNSYVLNFDKDGNIVPASIIDDVIAKTIGGSRLDHDEERRKEVKESWIEFAIQEKLVASRADRPGIDRLKAALGDLYASIDTATGDEIDTILDAGKSAIDAAVKAA